MEELVEFIIQYLILFTRGMILGYKKPAIAGCYANTLFIKLHKRCAYYYQ
jgi:hypothetical protein